MRMVRALNRRSSICCGRFSGGTGLASSSSVAIVQSLMGMHAFLVDRAGSPISPVPSGPVCHHVMANRASSSRRCRAGLRHNMAHMATEPSTLAAQVDALLPQTQCEQCGYHGCRPYADAIVRGEARINQCPPGGAAGIAKLAALLQRPALPLNPEHGVEKPRMLARIVEADCIGCTKCIQACPVDAIIGASKLMHVVLADDCTGCELCVPACPVDCIELVPMPAAQVD